MTPREDRLPWGPYALTDRRLSGGMAHPQMVADLIEGGANLIQVREKYVVDPRTGACIEPPPEGHPPLSLDDWRASLSAAIALARKAGAILIVNDDPRLAAELGADGAHVGQEDMPAREARRCLGRSRLLGLSTHTREQFLAALEEPVDYVAIGPVFGTTSKISPHAALGLDFVRWAAAGAGKRRIPLVAIGGISPTNIAALLDAAPHIHPAVLSAVIKPGQIAESTRRFIERMLPSQRP